MLKVMDKCCGQCLYTKGKIVSSERKRSILADCKRTDTHFSCHKSTIVGEDVVCAGFAQRESTNMMRIAGRLGMIETVSSDEYTKRAEDAVINKGDL